MDLIEVDIYTPPRGVLGETLRVVQLAFPNEPLSRALRIGDIRFSNVSERFDLPKPRLLGIQLSITHSLRFRRVMIKDGKIDLDRIRCVHADLVEVIAENERRRTKTQADVERRHEGPRRLYVRYYDRIRTTFDNDPNSMAKDDLDDLLQLQRAFPKWTITEVEDSLKRMEEDDAKETEAGAEGTS